MQKQRLEKVWNWRMIFKVLHVFIFPFFVIWLVSFSVTAAVEIKHLTVNDHLRQEKSSGKKENRLS